MANQPKRKNYRIRYDRIIYVVIILVVFILLITSCVGSCGKKEKVLPGAQKPVEDQLETLPGGAPAQPAETQAPAPEPNYSTITKDSDDIHTGDLILVNAAHPCKFNPEAIEDGNSTDVQLVTIKEILDTKESRHYTAADWEVGMDRTAAYAMDAWYEAFYTATGNTDIRMIKGYTSDSGDLDFRAGRTLTMGTYPESGSSNFYKPEGTYAWLAEHAAEFGFVQRYLEDKESLYDDTITSRTLATYRYVGIAPAVYMTQKGICLEEFLEEIKSYSIDSMLKVSSGGVEYGMYYIPANLTSSSTSFAVPNGDIPVTISGNNVDGFIIIASLNGVASDPAAAAPQYEDLDD